MNVERLQLDRARALFAQAGRPLPDPALGAESFIQALLDGLCDLSSRDPLTGVLNRRSLMLVLEQELDRSARSGDSALLLIVDIDHFKSINDVHGHLTGDAVIKAVAQALNESVRPMDTVARFGGEEFAVVLPSCPPAFAHVVGERIRSKVSALQLPQPHGVVGNITVSCGGAFSPPWLRSHPGTWLERADAQMYRAKAAGRNTVCIEPQPVSEVSAEEKGLLFGLTADNDLMMSDPASPTP